MATKNEEFYKDLLKVCRKHKANLDGNVSFNTESKEFNVIVNGGWDIRLDNEQLEVHEIKPAERIFTIMGTKKV